jgi:pyruvate/2-oxoglutarate dehydrogenase complex dihydrolipoamide dehydrogenase (E3) component
MIPPIQGLADTPYLTYETVFDLGALPDRLLVLGAGPVGLELGQAFQRLGAQVTVFDQADRILTVADPEASAVVSERLTGEGLVLRLGASVERVVAHGNSVTVTAGGVDHVGDALLVAVGRRASVDGLGLEQAGVATSERGIVVDKRLRSSQRHIYAAGDVTGAAQFTHYAGWQGAIATRNALLPGAMAGIPARVPWAVFTVPEVAQVGLSEDEVRGQGRGVRVQRWPLTRIDRAHTVGDLAGFIKLVARRDGRLLGATIVAAQASELVNEVTLALDRRLTVDHLARTMHVYPTYGVGVQQAAGEATLDRLTRGWRGRLLRALARRWIRWTSRAGH